MRANNMAAMREAAETALMIIRGIISGTIARTNNSVFDCRDKLKDALALPPRNCDVGAAEEQAKRFGKLCNKYYNEDEPCNRKCPLASLDFIKGFPRCQAYWAQMPYEAEEGGLS